MSKPNPQNENLDNWESCQGGELQSLGHSLRKAERTRIAGQVVKRSLIAAAAVIMLAFSINTLTTNSLPGGISCTVCHDSFASYEQHLTKASLMAESEASAMATHLTECSTCQGIFERDYPGLLSAAGATAVATFSLLGLFVVRHG